MMETAKAQILKRLYNAIEKLKEARKEIHEAVLAALEMKEHGNDIADQVIHAMAVLATDDIEALTQYYEQEEQAIKRGKAA
jgi:CHASE3 domain sensor protein